MAGISCGAVWLSGFNKDSINKKCEEALNNIIDSLDDDKNGRINIKSFVDFLAEYDIIIDPYEVEEMHSLADEKDELGKIALKTFAKHSWFWSDLEHQAEDIFRKSNTAAIAFNAMDIDDDGFLTKSELGQVMTSLSESQITGIFQKYDESYDGRLTLTEFKKFMDRRKLLNKVKN